MRWAGSAVWESRRRRWAGGQGRSPGQTPHPGSPVSTMNVVHVFFLKILGIQLCGQEQGVGMGCLQCSPTGHGIPHPVPYRGTRIQGPQRPPPLDSGVSAALPQSSSRPCPRTQESGPFQTPSSSAPRIWASSTLLSENRETRRPAPCSLRPQGSATVPVPSGPPCCHSRRNLFGSLHSLHQPRFQIRPEQTGSATSHPILRRAKVGEAGRLRDA